jgi:hypothetical protein
VLLIGPRRDRSESGPVLSLEFGDTRTVRPPHLGPATLPPSSTYSLSWPRWSRRNVALSLLIDDDERRWQRRKGATVRARILVVRDVAKLPAALSISWRRFI